MFAVHMYPRAHVIIINIVINIRVLRGRSLGTPMVRACFVKTRNNIVFEFFFFFLNFYSRTGTWAENAFALNTIGRPERMCSHRIEPVDCDCDSTGADGTLGDAQQL